MLENDYAFIKDGVVINTVVIEDLSSSLINDCKNTFNIDDVIKCTEKAVIGSTWNGSIFILPKPYPSWILDENNDWISPLPMPTDETKNYSWNEETLNWDASDKIDL